jgi:hypothetical protein
MRSVMISFFLALLLPVDLLLHLRLLSMVSPQPVPVLVNHMRDRHKKEEGDRGTFTVRHCWNSYATKMDLN